MSSSETNKYRETYPHVAPELCNGDKPTTASDIYSFGHMYCLTMKEMKAFLGEQEKDLLELGKKLSHYRPQRRPEIMVALQELAHLGKAVSFT